MRNFIQLCVMLMTAHRATSQSIYRGRTRGGSSLGGLSAFESTGRRGGGDLFSQGSFSSLGGQTGRGFGTGGQQSLFGSRSSFNPSSLTASSGRTGSSFGSGFQTQRRPVSSFQDTGFAGNEPSEVRRILGSTIIGREMRMGERGLPRHGGAGVGEEHANGLMRGWDGNPQTLGNRFQDEWTEPSRGRQGSRSSGRHWR